MNSPEHDDFSELEADLRALRPRPASAGFLARVDTESALRSVCPRRPSPGFNDRVARACGAAAPRIIRFPTLRVTSALAAALAVAALLTLRPPTPEPAQPLLAVVEKPAPTRAVPAATPRQTAAYAQADDGTILPVINLGDGRAYRPTLRQRNPGADAFRATPAGILPVSCGATLEYSPVEYE